MTRLVKSVRAVLNIKVKVRYVITSGDFQGTQNICYYPEFEGLGFNIYNTLSEYKLKEQGIKFSIPYESFNIR